ncbi:pPIWI-associating nuclease domain-containing protein [Mesorhizobium sp. RSR565B]|uniref:pPIWI-associating nuclease domain-containing protein n=1 Tax=Mesorhizobium sp. L103C565B0 TaxID=1287094 RepID=UPI0003D06874|nr:hypothetical protein [Mesorhizobium sp. L103C565B0]ESZ44666.1 hypothetical protein X730_25470 [Mesorhizobium sp. L103C565B0]
MARKMTPSQYNSWARQQNAKIQNEVNRVNRANKAELDRVNRHNKKVTDDFNRAIRQHNQNARAAVNKYNQWVRTHNAQVEQQRRRQIAALRNQTTTTYVEVRTSTYDLNERYDRIERDTQRSSGVADLLALSEREASNSATVAEAFTSATPTDPDAISDSGILEYLAGFSQDLSDRWKGALFALNPANTDAGRHFCTSVREIFTEILERWAENEDVIAADGACEMSPNGTTPSRRAKIRYLLKKKGADSPEMLGFVEKDIDDILQLFHVFNEATHGAAGKYGFAKLLTIRQRVEGGIMFLAAIAL